MSAKTTPRDAGLSSTPRRLTRAECLALLAEHEVGRLALTVRALPYLVPVAYEVDADEIVFRVDDSPEVEAALGDAVVAFAIDDFVDHDCSYRVHVTGVARLEPVRDALEGPRAARPGTDKVSRDAPVEDRSVWPMPADAAALGARLLGSGRASQSRVVRLRPEFVIGEAASSGAPPMTPHGSASSVAPVAPQC